MISQNYVDLSGAIYTSCHDSLSEFYLKVPGNHVEVKRLDTTLQVFQLPDAQLSAFVSFVWRGKYSEYSSRILKAKSASRSVQAK